MGQDNNLSGNQYNQLPLIGEIILQSVKSHQKKNTDQFLPIGVIFYIICEITNNNRCNP